MRSRRHCSASAREDGAPSRFPGLSRPGDESRHAAAITVTVLSTYERHLLRDIEEAFRNLKGDRAIRPVFYRDETRIEAHIFTAFLAYRLKIALTRRLHSLAPVLRARRALEKFAAVPMIDVHLPTTDGREIVLTRFTEPEPDLRLLLDRLKLQRPAQPPPKIAAAALPAQPLL
jgi:hypothetical protein